MLAPIVLFVYNRPNHTKATVEALAKNTLAKESELYIFADGPKEKKSNDNIEKTRDYIKGVQEKYWFKNIVISLEEQNKGLANSVIDGVSKIITKHQKIIVLEDDIVAGPNFLQYMNDALDFYKDNEKIWSISGYTMNMRSLKKYSECVYFGYRASSWGWGTWLNRWEKVDWAVKDFETFILNKKLRKKFNRGGRDMSKMLEEQIKGNIDSWAIRWCYQQSKYDMLTVFPRYSQVKNIGCDGSGTHSGVSSQFDVQLENSDMDEEFKFIEPYLDKQITKEFYDTLSGALKIRIRNKLKHVFIK